MSVYLVRHAHAGSRSSWKGDDGLRPLSSKGHAQAERLAKTLAQGKVRRILSSPAVRCIETVEPLAHKLSLDIDQRKELLEGADPDALVQLLLELGGENVVVSSHGDLIPKVIRRLVAQGCRTKDPNISQKASFWTIDVDHGAAVKAKYYPPV